MIQQIYSNADGTVQFVEIYDRGQNDCDAGEAVWAGQTLYSTGSGPDRSFEFPANLPTCATSGKHILIATQGFAALGIVAPDYVIPNGFIQIPNGTLYFAGLSSVTYTSLPNDGVTSILADGTPIHNFAMNLAGQSASVTAAPPPVAIVPAAGVWWNKSEPGSGLGIDYQNGTLIVEVYSYRGDGSSQWYLAAGSLANNVFTGTLDKYTGGQCVSCVYKAPTTVGNDGTITITFTSATTGIADLPGARHIAIERYFTGQPKIAPAGSFIPLPGVWWNKNEPGSGLGLDYQDGTLIAEVYSYLSGGASQWYLAAGPLANNVFTATLDKYTAGQCISCAYKAPGIAGNDGSITIIFTSATTATVDLPGGRHIQVERYFQ